MDYSTETKILCAKYNLSASEIIFCYAVAAGADHADTYGAIYKTKLNRDQCRDAARLLFREKPGLKVLVNAIQAKRPGHQAEIKDGFIIEDERNKEEGNGDELKTRAGLLQRLLNVTQNLKGKEELQGLVTLAKIQGFDRPDEEDDEEKRVYFLPWVSNCRACELLRVFMEASATTAKETT